MKGLFHISLLLWLVLGGGCSEADAPERDANETDGLTPVSCTLSMQAGEGTTEEEKTINDLTVLQFDGTGEDAKCITSRYLLSPVAEGGTGSTYSIGLRMTESGGYIIFIANAGPQFRSYEEAGKTLSDFKKETLILNQQTANEKNVLMIGTATLAAPGSNASETTAAESGEDNIIEIQLKRLVARIRFTWKLVPTVTNTTFEPVSLKLRSVSKELRYMEETTSVYPASDVDNFKDYTAIVDEIDKGFTWYIPMNRRGKGTDVVNVWDKTAEHAPDEFCTFIELSGIFRTPNMPDQLATYRFYVGGDNRVALADGTSSIDYNDYNVEANGDYEVKATIVGINTFDKRVEKKNFVYQEPANCFMVAPEDGAGIAFSPYKLPGTDVAGCGIVYQDQVIEGIYSKIAGARVLWQTAENLVETSIGQGMVSVTPNDQGVSGNALIGVYDESDNILWSWHIWVTPYAAIAMDDGTDVLVGSLQSYNNQVWMDRNLGALNTLTPAVAEVMYQWGRKDPFLTNYYSTHSDLVDPLVSAIKEPDKFYIVSSSTAFWYGNSIQPTDLWQDNGKTVFDPCPYGWRVPPDGSWDGFEQNINFYTWNLDRYSTYTEGSVSSIYRLGGKIVNTTGKPDLPSKNATDGYLWSSTRAGSGTDAYGLYYKWANADGNQSNGYVYPNQLSNQSFGFPVRCIKIK